MQSGFDKVLVLYGSNLRLKEKIDRLSDHAEYTGRIISPPTQNDHFVARVAARCLTAVIRGGGLTVMERLAMTHHPEQIIFIHYSDACGEVLKSGIIWEDHNVDKLIQFLEVQQIRVIKIRPMDLNEKLQELGLCEVTTNCWNLS